MCSYDEVESLLTSKNSIPTFRMFLWLTTLIRHDITIPKITRQSMERSPLGLASYRAYVSLFMCFDESMKG